MKIKNMSVGIAGVILLIAAGLPQTVVAKDVNMNLRFAGAFITADSLPSALIHVTALGSPGKVEIRGYGGVDDVIGVVDCLGSLGFRINILENPLVFKFQDLSLLFAKGGTGTICIRTTGMIDFEINIVFDGGRGRFEDATGTAVITGEAEAVNVDRSFLAETGTIVGTIVLP